jgi:hypothetical protein
MPHFRFSFASAIFFRPPLSLITLSPFSTAIYFRYLRHAITPMLSLPDYLFSAFIAAELSEADSRQPPPGWLATYYAICSFRHFPPRHDYFH